VPRAADADDADEASSSSSDEDVSGQREACHHQQQRHQPGWYLSILHAAPGPGQCIQGRVASSSWPCAAAVQPTATQALLSSSRQPLATSMLPGTCPVPVSRAHHLLLEVGWSYHVWCACPVYPLPQLPSLNPSPPHTHTHTHTTTTPCRPSLNPSTPPRRSPTTHPAACAPQDDDDDDEEALKAELERIRADRAAEAEKKAAQEEARRAAASEAELRGGNPLLGGLAAGGGPLDFSVKRR
jgi:hypothetical protein